uniref:Uncharacterized protein n=1 Tax=Opuntia streptacantha TaxID=393608 RepID=A0A7C9D8C0_OPUST
MDLPMKLSGPSSTVVGEGVLVVNLASVKSRRGGRSRHLGVVVVVAVEGRARVVQGRGLPGCSSHLKGTDACVCRGELRFPECCRFLSAGRENRGRLLVGLLPSLSSFDPISLSLLSFCGAGEKSP